MPASLLHAGEAAIRELDYRIRGAPVRINVVEYEQDLEGFVEFVRRNPVLGFDTEATGLDIFTPGFSVRLAQLGTTRESWVLPVEKSQQFAWYAAKAIEKAQGLICHNATYDLLVADRHLGVPIESTYGKTTDTRTLSHLVDPRAAHEGGTGHSLEDLTRSYVSVVVADEIKGSVRDMAKELKTTKAKFWSEVPIDHQGYNLYAGMDPILTSILARVLEPKVPSSARKLIQYEHELARICALMERKGFLIDVPYLEELSERLAQEQERYERQALNLGLENVNSPQQVSAALMKDGWTPTKFTPTGQPKVDKRELEALVAKGSPLAEAIMKAKRANKWRTAYVDTFLELRDSEDRIHCGINSLQARTARMSITRPALQTLPAGEHMIRSAFLAEMGEVIGSIDYIAMELRVLAALSNDQVMREVFESGGDLHWMTARAAFGPDATEKHRKTGKLANFQRVYGGGAKALAEATGLPLSVCEGVGKAFDNTYIGVAAYAQQLQAQARRQGYITTITGRVLPVDRSRAYSALNYMIQSSSRDVLGRALINLDKAGLTEHLRLPVHDEIVVSLPLIGARELSKVIAEHMQMDLRGVDIATDPEIGARSWGSLYV
ncbi:DNA polymerase [Streptosporangium canum]|uniref:DNA polymerase n=1 Tax=Streptosporangium canum TaxID=324952 RepID=UPI0036AB8EA2